MPFQIDSANYSVRIHEIYADGDCLFSSLSKPTIERQQEEQDDQEEQLMDVELEAEELQDAAEMNVPDELSQPMVNVPNQEQQPGYVNLESDIQSEIEFKYQRLTNVEMADSEGLDMPGPSGVQPYARLTRQQDKIRRDALVKKGMQLHRDANPFYTEDFYIKMAEFEIKIEQESLIYRIFSIANQRSTENYTQEPQLFG